MCAVDDKDARKAAEAHNLDFIGVRGLLDRLEEVGLLVPSKKGEIVKRLKDSGFYFPGGASDLRRK